MAQIHHKQAPYAPRWGYLIPALSLALTIPSLAAMLSLGGLATIHALTGYSLPVSAPPLQSSLGFAAVVCYIVFGPLLGFLLCVSQRASAAKTYGSDLLLGYRMKRLNTIALWCAGLAISVMMLALFLSMLLRAGT